ncbi:MAG TPA: hypothetical protein VLE97_01910 [Gaiellaceae bacterium]|nr:hypothetical protein [Gaiellaceae bacterium]
MKILGQYLRVALIEFDYTDSAAQQQVPALSLPYGAKLLAGSTVIITPSNAASTDVGNLGIASAATRNVAAVNLKAAAGTTVAFTALTLVDGDILVFSRVLGGANGTAGKGYMFMYYVMPEVSDFNPGKVADPTDLNGST